MAKFQYLGSVQVKLKQQHFYKFVDMKPNANTMKKIRTYLHYNSKNAQVLVEDLIQECFFIIIITFTFMLLNPSRMASIYFHCNCHTGTLIFASLNENERERIKMICCLNQQGSTASVDLD